LEKGGNSEEKKGWLPSPQYLATRNLIFLRKIFVLFIYPVADYLLIGRFQQLIAAVEY